MVETSQLESEEATTNLSALILAMVTLAIYLLFLRPKADRTPPPQQQQQQQQTTSQPRQRQRTVQAPPPPPAARNNTVSRRRHNKNQLSENAMEILTQCQSTPPHVVVRKSTTKPTAATIGGFHMLNDNGLVAFSHTKAAAAAAKTGDSLKSTAKILSRLLPPGSKPPSKGSTVVLGLEQAQHLPGQLESIASVIESLSGHYTILLMVLVSSSSSNPSYSETLEHHQKICEMLRSKVSEIHLPDHRILVSCTTSGKVALVRQLSIQNMGLVIDSSKTVQTELERFGFKVSLVEDWNAIRI